MDEAICPGRGTGAEALLDAGRGTGGFVNSSRGGMNAGRGATTGFTGICFLSALLTSARRASSSRRCCRSYMMDDRTCSMRAEVTSSVTRRLCLARALWRFCEMPSARRARICS